MRVYRNIIEARNEIQRDLNELGILVDAGYQSLEVADMTTRELQNYDYRVLRPDYAHLEPKTEEYCWQEWRDRLAGIQGAPTNPGHSWRYREEMWKPLLEDAAGGPPTQEALEGPAINDPFLLAFSYTYSERLFAASVPDILNALRKHRNSRQAYVGIWNPVVDGPRLGVRRVPCSLGYHFIIRDNELHVTYHMRSSDFSTHWDNDIWLALKFQEWMAEQLLVVPGTFTHSISSLHVYQRDVEGVF